MLIKPLIRLLIHIILVVGTGFLYAQQNGNDTIQPYCLGAGVVFFIMSDYLSDN